MRLFVAIELSDAVRAALANAQIRMKPRCEDVRWVRPELLHITLKFLGEVPDGDVSGVAETVVQAAASIEPFAIMISGIACFPHGRPVRIVWSGIAQPADELRHCAEAVDAELEMIGFPREQRPFSPHITIGRVRQDRSDGRLRKVVEACELGAAEQPVKAITLMSSVLSPSGPTYSAVQRVDLE